jgi:hypothetical protein
MDAKAAVFGTIAVGCALAVATVRHADARVIVDPCSLLTVAQVSAALGANVGAGKPIYTDGCSWHGTSSQSAVTIKFETLTRFSELKSRIHPGIPHTPLAGVGDDAFYLSLGTTTSNLTVKKGNQAFVVRVYGVPDQAKQRDIEKAIAKAVVAKL